MVFRFCMIFIDFQSILGSPGPGEARKSFRGPIWIHPNKILAENGATTTHFGPIPIAFVSFWDFRGPDFQTLFEEVNPLWTLRANRYVEKDPI